MIERIGAAAATGFDGIEIQFPYDLNPESLRAELQAHDMPLILMNFPVGDLMQGGEGLAAIPGREAEFENALKQAQSYAEILRPRAMNLLAGRPGPGHDPAACDSTLRASLRQAYRLTSALGIRLLTEPVNTVDLPGFFLHGSQQALELIEALPDIELGMQYDLYHMYMMEANIDSRLPAVIDHVGHIQFSDVPGRTEPGLGSLDFPGLFALIDSLAYDGYVGAEYFPSRDTRETLEWLGPYRQGRVLE